MVHTDAYILSEFFKCWYEEDVSFSYTTFYDGKEGDRTYGIHFLDIHNNLQILPTMY